MKVEFEAKNDKELLAAVAMWLAMELQRNKDEPVITPKHGGGGGAP